MSYIVFCTFDITNGSTQTYSDAYKALAEIGLAKVHTSDDGRQAVVPTTSVMGTFNGPDAVSVSNDVLQQAKSAFRSLGLISEIFIVVGDNWAWRAGVT